VPWELSNQVRETKQEPSIGFTYVCPTCDRAPGTFVVEHCVIPSIWTREEEPEGVRQFDPRPSTDGKPNGGLPNPTTLVIPALEEQLLYLGLPNNCGLWRVEPFECSAAELARSRTHLGFCGVPRRHIPRTRKSPSNTPEFFSGGTPELFSGPFPLPFPQLLRVPRRITLKISQMSVSIDIIHESSPGRLPRIQMVRRRSLSQFQRADRRENIPADKC
jgi:hypothetical protein